MKSYFVLFRLPYYLLNFFLFSLALEETAGAAVTVTGDFATGSPVPTVALTAGISFSINSTGSLQGIAFDEWVLSDGISNTATIAPFSQTMAYSINGGNLLTVPVSSLIDNAATVVNDLTANDGYLYFFTGVSVFSGDIITFQASNFTFSPVAGFNPGSPPLFEGQAFVINSTGVALSGLTAIPELSSSFLSLVAVMTAVVCKRRVIR
jgi:hypothetical protein